MPLPPHLLANTLAGLAVSGLTLYQVSLFLSQAYAHAPMKQRLMELYFRDGGDLTVEQTETLDEEVESVSCRWCSSPAGVVTVDASDG